MDWFFGFKLHLIFNEKRALLNFMITQGGVDDRKPLAQLIYWAPLLHIACSRRNRVSMCKEHQTHSLHYSKFVELTLKIRKLLSDRWSLSTMAITESSIQSQRMIRGGRGKRGWIRMLCRAKSLYCSFVLTVLSYLPTKLKNIL